MSTFLGFPVEPTPALEGKRIKAVKVGGVLRLAPSLYWQLRNADINTIADTRVIDLDNAQLSAPAEDFGWDAFMQGRTSIRGSTLTLAMLAQRYRKE